MPILLNLLYLNYFWSLNTECSSCQTDSLFGGNLNAMALAALATGSSLQQPPSLTPPPSIPSISSVSASSPLSVASGLSAAQQLSAASQLNFSAAAQQLSVAQSLQQQTAPTHPFAFLAAANNGQLAFNGGALPLYSTAAGGQAAANGMGQASGVGVSVPMALNGMGIPLHMGFGAVTPMGMGLPVGIPAAAMSNLNLLQLIAANSGAVPSLPATQNQAYAALLQQAVANQAAAAAYPVPRCELSTVTS